MSTGKFGFEKAIVRLHNGPTVDKKRGVVSQLATIGTGEGQAMHTIQMDLYNDEARWTEFGQWLEEYNNASELERTEMIEGRFEATGIYHHNTYQKRDKVTGKAAPLASFSYVSVTRWRKIVDRLAFFSNLPEKRKLDEINVSQLNDGVSL